jgi:hypothetical protein
MFITPPPLQIDFTYGHGPKNEIHGPDPTALGHLICTILSIFHFLNQCNKRLTCAELIRCFDFKTLFEANLQDKMLVVQTGIVICLVQFQFFAWETTNSICGVFLGVPLLRM